MTPLLSSHDFDLLVMGMCFGSLAGLCLWAWVENIVERFRK